MFSAYLIIPFIIATGVYARRARPVGPIENNIIFEKLEYKMYDENLVKMNYYEFKSIAHNVLRVNGSLTILKPFDEIWIRGVLYYKYTLYQKFLVDVEIELCHLLRNENLLFAFPFFKLATDNFMPLFEDILDSDLDMDFEVKCPFNGTVSAYLPHLNVSKIVVPLLPAGRFRLDMYYKQRKDGPLVVKSQHFFQISDLRVWF